MISITGSEDMFAKHKIDEVICVAKPRHSLMVQNVLDYIMQMRFLQFLKVDEKRLVLPPGLGESPPKSHEASVRH